MYCCLVHDHPDHAPAPVLEQIARACSPRVEVGPDGGRAVIFDASGLDRAIGTAAEIGAAVGRLARDRGVPVRVALARTSVAAWLLAHARTGVTVATADPAAALAPLPLGWLAVLPETGPRPPVSGPGKSGSGPVTVPGSGAPGRGRDRGRPSARNYRMAPGPAPGRADGVRAAVDAAAARDIIAVLERWGIRTLGDLARLPRGDLQARTGPAGVRLHQAACGEDVVPLVPVVEAARFLERLELEWPIEGLEPLSFVLARMCDALSRALERADRGAVAIATRLHLVTRETHARTLNLPAPMRDARVLRTLIQLDLESHPPPAAIDVVELELDVVAGRIVQGSLLARSLPSPEDLATLTARLQALMGETRVGAPALVDTHDDRQLAMRPFTVSGPGPRAPGPDPRPVLAPRRLRHPIPARVTVEHGLPVRVQPSARGLPSGRVIGCAGPWRTSGHWWVADGTGWDREEWDVEIDGGGCYRLARVRSSRQWEIDSVLD